MLVLIGIVLWVPMVGERSVAELLIQAVTGRVMAFTSWIAYL